MITRRDMLRLLAGATGTAAILSACSRAAADPTTTTTSSSTTTTIAPTTTAARTTTTTTTTTTEPPAPTTTSPPQIIEVLAREGWTDRPQGEFRRHRVERITIHHTASLLTDDRRAPQLARQHLGWHQSHGWPDLAYHFIVDRQGNVYEGRPIDAVGDTFTSYDPTGHLLACLEGNFDRQEPAPAQLTVLTGLVAWAMQRFGVASDRVTGHRDWARTSCPGDDMHWRLDGIARTAADARVVELGYIRGDDARDRVAAIEAG